jgi:hypothetical protein
VEAEFIRADRLTKIRTDRYEEAISSFKQFCDSAYKHESLKIALLIQAAARSKV